MRTKWAKIAIITILILLPIIIGAFYRKSAHALYKRFVYPSEIVFATGPDGGRYRPISDALIAEINRSDIGTHANPRHTAGSLENLRLVRDRKAQFALYQPDTAEILATSEGDSLDGVKFVANLYSQPSHLIVRRGANIATPAELRGKSVNLGAVNSGDYAMGLMLLEHFGLTERDINPRHLDYAQTRLGFEDGTLDAAIITIGVQAPMLRELFATGHCELRPIPNREALTWNRIAISEFRIPRGIYGSQPTRDIDTVALGAQLLTHETVPAGLVKEATALIMNENFLKRNGLRELFLDESFARQRPGFALHPGARSYYDHGFDIHIFEALDALYSLVASVAIAAFLVFRSWRSRLAKSKEHRLDRYMHSLLEIEQRQVALDSKPESNDTGTLQSLLDEVTFLRQDALKELTAHELNEDPAANSFVEMCHALSNKINAKISRQRTQQGIQRLTEVVEQVLQSRVKSNTPRNPE